MISISISEEFKHVLPDLALGCVSARVKVEKYSEALWEEINLNLSGLATRHKLEEVASIPQITGMRNAYKKLGKDPSRYRGSAEALLRRVLTGRGLYQINTLVDINNLISLESLFPAGSYDLGKVISPIELRVGRSGETYKGIGKEEINIQNLPVFADARGAFGSPTSDSERAMIRLDTTDVLMVLFSFSGPGELEHWTGRAGWLLQQFAGGTSLETELLQ